MCLDLAISSFDVVPKAGRQVAMAAPPQIVHKHVHVPMVQKVQKTVEVPQVQYEDQIVQVPVAKQVRAERSLSEL